MSPSSEVPNFDTFDGLALALRELRLRVGNPSYAELARRIAEQRTADGATAAAAAIARSTVYDVFRPGRARVNPALIGEVVQALGESPEVSAEWVDRARRTRSSKAIETPALVTQPELAPSLPPQMPLGLFTTLVLVACVGVNLFGNAVTDKFHWLIWLDMAGTAVASFVFGPWHGALVGLLTNGLGTLAGNWTNFPFALVNIAGALVWGYAWHRSRANRSGIRFLAMGVTVGLVCSLVAVPVSLYVFGGDTGYAGDEITAFLARNGVPALVATFLTNLPFTLLDKTLSGYVALTVARPLLKLRPSLDHAGHRPGSTRRLGRRTTPAN